MSASSASLMGFARSTAKNGAVHLDPVTIALTLGIVLLGLVMVTSASVSIAGQESGQGLDEIARRWALSRRRRGGGRGADGLGPGNRACRAQKSARRLCRVDGERLASPLRDDRQNRGGDDQNEENDAETRIDAVVVADPTEQRE